MEKIVLAVDHTDWVKTSTDGEVNYNFTQHGSQGNPQSSEERLGLTLFMFNEDAIHTAEVRGLARLRQINEGKGHTEEEVRGFRKLPMLPNGKPKSYDAEHAAQVQRHDILGKP
jgi:hypothetical protein